MKKKYFEHWNWELDVGEEELFDVLSLPPSHAVVLYDYWGRIYRVEIHNLGRDVDRGEVFCYDYFYNSAGLIVEKRSLDINRNVDLIIKITYNSDGQRVNETCWQTGGDYPPTIAKARNPPPF